MEDTSFVVVNVVQVQHGAQEIFRHSYSGNSYAISTEKLRLGCKSL